MYSTSAHEVGLKPPTIAQLPMKWFAQSGTFSKEFQNADRGDVRNLSTLQTSSMRSNVHHALDQGWRGDAHSSMLYAANGRRRKIGSQQRVF